MLSVLVSVLGLVLVAGVILFGFVVARQRHWLWERPIAEHLLIQLIDKDANTRLQAVQAFVELSANSRARRNEFWTTYGQIVLSIFVVTILQGNG
jgi:hypothetical protein